MSDPNTVLPAAAPSGLLRVQESSKLAFGATTAALVALASGGTAVLVAQGASTLSSPTSVPGLAAPLSGGGGEALVVTRPAGTLPPTAGAGAVELTPDEVTAQVLRDALAFRPQPGPRTLIVPLVALPELPEPAVPTVPTFVPEPELPAVPVDVPVELKPSKSGSKPRSHHRDVTALPRLSHQLQMLAHEEDKRAHKAAKPAHPAKPAKAEHPKPKKADKAKGSHAKTSSSKGKHAR